MPTFHLVILKKPYLDAVLAGQKTVESRFLHAKKPPFGQVQPGDKLFLKQSSGPVYAIATIENIETYENLTAAKISKLKEQYNHLIGGADDYWQEKSDCPLGLLLWLKDVCPIEPVRIWKKDWRAWVVLTEKENFGLFGNQIRRLQSLTGR